MKKNYKRPCLDFYEKIKNPNILLGIILSEELDIGVDTDVDMEEE